jgi:hypothetical protein
MANMAIIGTVSPQNGEGDNDIKQQFLAHSPKLSLQHCRNAAISAIFSP